MNFKSDIVLKHPAWKDALLIMDKGGFGIFYRYVDIFIIACSLGVADDKRVPDEQGDIQVLNIPRSTMITNSDINESLEFLFQNAILNTKSVDLDMEKRKELAFNLEYTDENFNVNKFLAEFANYGMTLIAKEITDHPIQTMQNLQELIKSYIDNIVPQSELDEQENELLDEE